MNTKLWLSAFLNKRNVNIDHAIVHELVEKYDIDRWFSYIAKERANRWDIWKPAFFLAKRLESNSSILETGCGMGINLIWFYENGLRDLVGTDINEEYINAANELAEHYKYKINYLVEDGLNPKLDRKFNAVLAVNWTHLLSEFDLGEFLKRYYRLIEPSGFLIFDSIDVQYNNHPLNKYLTSDWEKPEDQRSPSEYKKRYSRDEVDSIAKEQGFKVAKVFSEPKDIIPRNVYILQKLK
jgi:cyclopropane fatty-acyl-phospholipid synthase-like methyltransferase